jgi:prepilin-type N-terminal cleavage/methylation domain-containing protein|tara:strand:+ start:478 stop:906 length:429 start_codon:yes stop_codon:yes gene_type:complete
MKNSKGFTLIELVVTIALVGILLGTAIPTFHRVVSETQQQVSMSNMGIIKNTFMQYYYDNHMTGNPHFPPVPSDSLLNDSYRQTILEDGRTPDMLFSGDLPYNTNNKPYIYYWDNDLNTKRIVIKDIDPDSPSYNEKVVGEI